VLGRDACVELEVGGEGRRSAGGAAGGGCGGGGLRGGGLDLEAASGGERRSLSPADLLVATSPTPVLGRAAGPELEEEGGGSELATPLAPVAVGWPDRTVDFFRGMWRNERPGNDPRIVL